MGTNYYVSRKGRNCGKHIGKMYAAGIWCWDCREKADRDHIGAFSFCPRCGKRTSDSTLAYNPALKELFGTKPASWANRSGVDGASGFIWNTTTEYGIADGRDAVKAKLKRFLFVKDEYGRKIEIQEFLLMLNSVIEETDSRGDFC